jgi:hypothetical protein
MGDGLYNERVRINRTVILAVVLLSAVDMRPATGDDTRPPARSARATGAATAEPLQARAQRAEAAVPFKVGETLTYDVSWSSFLIAGTAVATVKDKTTAPNGPGYVIVAEGRPLPIVARIYPIYYKMDSLIDSSTLLSRQSSVYSEERDRRKTGTTRFDRPARKAFYEVVGDEATKSQLMVPAQTQDGLAALYALRAIPLRAGARLELPVANEGELFTVSVTVGTAERIRVPLGQFDAWGLKLTVVDASRQPVGNNMAVWISTDTRRLPVKLTAELPVGDFVLALKDVR